MENWVSLPVVAAQINCQYVMSNARVALTALLSKAQLIQLNAVHMTASFLTHEGFAAAERNTVVLGSSLSLNIEVWTLESPATPVLEYCFSSFVYFRKIENSHTGVIRNLLTIY